MGIFSLTRAGRIRRHAIATALSTLALAGVMAGGATTARALSTTAAGPAGVSCPATRPAP
jgi:hypothetical protein